MTGGIFSNYLSLADYSGREGVENVDGRSHVGD